MLNNSESLTAKICLYTRANHAIMHNKNKIFNDFIALNLIGKREYKIIEKMIKKISFPLNVQDFIDKYFCPCCPSKNSIYGR